MHGGMSYSITLIDVIVLSESELFGITELRINIGSFCIAANATSRIEHPLGDGVGQTINEQFLFFTHSLSLKEKCTHSLTVVLGNSKITEAISTM
ncbi:hypothetical protein XBKB1_3300002 [Xenorhabdus bovienii str. kraussei Becker Underwood]|uniref:Uncharacterized protein n=1 Tax=Xenorhabdus bovienii str. kraussei Becker Underwood TaxID=1398204 RepID=A0A077PV25_XENBV|nr:hypothetical protein XBKB1_3300002 [Xenorhabdus bovienii str. kraussei Becker Underwood]